MLSNSGNNQQDTLAAIIACVPPFFWVPLVLGKKNSFISYYMKQGFGLFVIMIIASFIPFVGWIVNPLITLCVLYLIYHVIIGKVVTIPYFSESLEKALVQLNIRSWFE